MDHQLPQQTVNYAVPSPKKDALCGNCFFYGGEGYCHIVKPSPAMIVSSGWCEMHKPREAVQDDLEAMLAETIEEITDGDATAVIVTQMEKKETPRPGRTRLMDAMKSIKNIFGRNDDSAGFKALGGGFWYAAYTNNFEDLEGEILTEKAHDRYLMRLEQKLIDPPELWLSHVRGSRVGEALEIFRAGNFMVAVGKFDENEIGQAAEKHFLTARKQYRLSHGFFYPKWAKKDRVYHDYNTFEISVLEDGTEANPFTAFEANKEFDAMPLSEQKKTSLRSILGDKADQVIQRAERWEEAGKALEEMGAKFKDFADLNPAPAPTSEETGLLLTDLFGDIEQMSNQLLTQGKALEKVIEQHKADREAATQKEAALESTIKELRDELSLTPRGADSGQTVDDTAAKAELDKRQQKDVAYDPMFPGMDVLVKATED